MEKLQYPNEPSEPELRMKGILDSLGLKYEYQFSVRSGFILDFAFPEKMIAFEVDGFYHQFRKKKDRFRDHILKRGGWRIVRVEASELDSPNKVRDLILKTLR